MAKWASTRHNQLPKATPTLRHPDTQHELAELADKAELFRDVFFPTPPEAELRDLQNAEYNHQIETPPIEGREIRDAIRTASPLKAPGPDGIPNIALQAGLATIASYLKRIFNPSLKLGIVQIPSGSL